MSTDFVPLSSIKLTGYDSAGEPPLTENSALVRAIKSTGQNPPMLVHIEGHLPNRTYGLLHGIETYQSCIAAGLDDVIVEVCHALTFEQIGAYREADLQRFRPPSPSPSALDSTLDPISEAESLQQAITTRGIRANRLAREIGIARSTLSNKLRLLRLCEPVRERLRGGLLTAAQARMLVSLDPAQQIRAADAMMDDDSISVRDAWQICRQARTHDPELHVTQTRRRREAARLAERISEQVGYPVQLNDQKRGGELRIRYFDYDGLDAILHRLRVVLED